MRAGVSSVRSKTLRLSWTYSKKYGKVQSRSMGNQCFGVGVYEGLSKVCSLEESGVEKIATKIFRISKNVLKRHARRDSLRFQGKCTKS